MCDNESLGSFYFSKYIILLNVGFIILKVVCLEKVVFR